jgi:hypothetical protein
VHGPPAAHVNGTAVVVVVGATVVVVVGATVVVVVATAATERIQVCRLPDAHAFVTDQRNTPDLPSAHNNNTLLTGTERNGAAQPDVGAMEIARFLDDPTTGDEFQHSNGADFVADQTCLPPTHLALEARRLATPDEGFTHRHWIWQTFGFSHTTSPQHTRQQRNCNTHATQTIHCSFLSCPVLSCPVLSCPGTTKHPM